MTQTTTPADTADRELKARHRTMWGLGDYPAVASQVIPTLGAELVATAGIGPGQRVLDVAAGSGNASLPAARAGASVVASDLSPTLLEAGRRLAGDLDISWVEADAENLPFSAGEFDAVISCVGVMFAPHHQQAADELVRVTRPGGTIALLSWTPEGFIGEMFAVMKPFAPPPPPGATPPPRWGAPDHVTALLGDRATTRVVERRSLVVDRFDTPADFREFFKATYGPTIVTFRNIAADTDAVAALDAALDALARRYDRGEGSLVMDWEYLLVTATRS